MFDIDTEIERVLDIEARFGLDDELNQYLVWLYRRKEEQSNVLYA